MGHDIPLLAAWPRCASASSEIWMNVGLGCITSRFYKRHSIKRRSEHHWFVGYVPWLNNFDCIYDCFPCVLLTYALLKSQSKLSGFHFVVQTTLAMEDYPVLFCFFHFIPLASYTVEAAVCQSDLESNIEKHLTCPALEHKHSALDCNTICVFHVLKFFIFMIMTFACLHNSGLFLVWTKWSLRCGE